MTEATLTTPAVRVGLCSGDEPIDCAWKCSSVWRGAGCEIPHQLGIQAAGLATGGMEATVRS